MEINKLNARILSKFGESGAVFGVGALELVKDYPELLILSADMSMVAGLERFKNTYPDHFFNTGIAEQNLIRVVGHIRTDVAVYRLDVLHAVVLKGFRHGQAERL